jgi:beta-galactosidase
MMTITRAPGVPRTTVLLNFDWQFRPGAVQLDYTRQTNDATWQTVQLPHDAAVGAPFDHEHSTSGNGWLPFGAGVYRKHFRLPADLDSARVLVEFEGVYRAAEVWLNGHYLGKQLNGYMDFELDLTAQVEPGEDNVLTVAYDNRTKDTSRWYTGEGIYRDVWLRLLSPVHIPRHGTCVTTPEIQAHAAVVAIATDVVNHDPRRRLCELVTRILDPQGREVAAATAVAPVAAGARYTFRQELDVASPYLWDVETPHLYTVVSSLRADGRAADHDETRFGIRSVRLTPQQGLLLNGRKVIAVGGDIHHDLGCLGSAALKRGYERHLDELKAIGCNSVRLSHNPHARVLLDACDEKGILVFDELYDKWTSQFYGGEAAFEQQWAADLERFIRRDRNHPCVYIWSMGNEVLSQQGQHDPKFETRAAAADYGVSILQRMVAHTRSLDPTRKVTCALFPAREGFVREWEHWADYDTFATARPAEMAFHMDVVSWNYTENMFAPDHATYPQMLFIASESAANWQFGTRRPSWLELDPAYLIGHYHWSAYDYLGESEWPKKTWGRALLDLSGWVTPLGRYYQSFYSPRPMVHIMVYETDAEQVARFAAIPNPRWDWPPMVDHWNWEGQPRLRLVTFSNCEQVELLLNGASLGTRTLSECENRRPEWDVPFAPGTLVAVGRTAGKEVARHALTTAGAPAALRLTPQTTTAHADGLDVVCVEAALVDAAGRLVPASGRRIRFAVSGPGVNAGVASGDVVSAEPWQGDSRSTWYGRCILLVRTSRTPGEITVTATAEALPQAECTISNLEPAQT